MGMGPPENTVHDFSVACCNVMHARCVFYQTNLHFAASLQASPGPPPSGHPPQSSPSPSSVHTMGKPSNNLDVEIKRLDQEYIKIEGLVLETIKYREVPLRQLLNWVQLLPVTLRTQFADILRMQAKTLLDASSVDELFFILSSYWNSFHPDLLEHVINKLGDEDLKARMNHYLDDLYHFRIRTTLGEFMDKWVGEIPPGYHEFVLELGEEWREKTVEDLEQFRIRLSRLQSFGGGHMSFMKTAKSSSILVMFALPQHLFPINLTQNTFL